MAVAKKYLGTNKSHSNYMDEFKKWLPQAEIVETEPGVWIIKDIINSLKEKEHD